MFYVTKDLSDFCAAHRVIKGYQGPCRSLHGHTYQVSVKVGADSLDQTDFVIDFADIKRLCDVWVQTNLDHAVIAAESDHKLIDFLTGEQQHFFVLPGGHNTSAERLAEFLFHQFTQLLQAFAPRVQMVEVTIAESRTSFASYNLLGCHFSGQLCGQAQSSNH